MTGVATAEPGGASILSLSPTDCPVCGDAEAEPVAVCRDFAAPSTHEAFLALRCAGCDSIYLNPAPDAARSVSTGQEDRVRPSRAVRRLARWKRGLDSASVLDVGTHHDSPLALRTRPDLPAAQESPAYALIMLNDMLEYCADPEAELAEVRERLRPGGRAVAAISNLGSPGFTVFGGRHWGGYDFPRQRALYSPRALRLMAGRAGLEVESLASAPNAACWVESAHRWLTDWRAPRWLSRRFLPSAVVAAGVFGLVEGLMHWRGRGSILVVSLRRPG